jgi:hypothetical protein
VLIKQLAFVPVERFHDEQVDCHATVPGVWPVSLRRISCSRSSLWPRSSLTCLMISLAAPQRARTSRVRARCAHVPALRPYMFAPLPSDGAAWSRAQGLPPLSTTPPGRYSRGKVFGGAST